MNRIILFVLSVLLFASCASQKRALYLQDLDTKTTAKIMDGYQIRVKPLDRLTIVVNSKNPELAAPFNTSSSFNSLSGSPISGETVSSNNNTLQVRTVDANGQLTMPIIGEVVCAGKTRAELAEVIAQKIIAGGHIADPEVNIQFADMTISVLGEVVKPGRYNITTDRVSLFDALSLAGDLTIYGVRKDVTVIREENGSRTSAVLDITSQDIFSSPYFYIQQNDVIYVKPNKYKAQSGEISQNRSFYISLLSTAISVATLIVTITNLK
ncbi:MAG: polysaccharide biosynthesis/export family protein [Alistipes sp.]